MFYFPVKRALKIDRMKAAMRVNLQVHFCSSLTLLAGQHRFMKIKI